MRERTSSRKRCTAATSASRERVEARSAAASGVVDVTPSSADGSPPAVRQQEDRPVHDADLSERSALVENLPAAQLEHEVGVQLGFGEERLERALLDRDHRLVRRHRESDGVPDLGHLDANRDRGPSLGDEADRLTLRAELRRESCAHSPTPAPLVAVRGTCGSVAKNRATCISNRYDEPVT